MAYRSSIKLDTVPPLSYHLIFRKEPEGGFTVFVPSLPGCITYGKTLEEAKEMAIDAITGYIESLRKHNEPVPHDEESFIASVQIEFPQKRFLHA